jgi:hypothetical protein
VDTGGVQVGLNTLEFNAMSAGATGSIVLRGASTTGVFVTANTVRGGFGAEVAIDGGAHDNRVTANTLRAVDRANVLISGAGSVGNRVLDNSIAGDAAAGAIDLVGGGNAGFAPTAKFALAEGKLTVSLPGLLAGNSFRPGV